MTNLRIIPAAVVFVLATVAPVWTALSYDTASTETWRQKREVDLTSEDGWLTVAGLHFLRPGENTVGTDPSSDVPLPDSAGVAAVGTIEFTPPRRVVLRLRDGVVAHTDGREARGQVEFLPADRATRRPETRVAVGGVTLQVHRSGDRVAIRLRDPRGPVRSRYAGLRWYPIDAAWAVPARFIPFQTPRRIPTQNILGDNTISVSPGEVELSLHGTTVRLLAFEADGKLSFVLSDASAGTDTYRLRFLSAEKPDPLGRFVVDFNRAYNPPCAFNPFTTCPLPVAQNRLKIAITAGEKLPVATATTHAAAR